VEVFRCECEAIRSVAIALKDNSVRRYPSRKTVSVGQRIRGLLSASKKVRCDLRWFEQDFNSLDAQHDAAQAFSLSACLFDELKYSFAILFDSLGGRPKSNPRYF